MISLEPEFAIDMPVNQAALPAQGAGPFAKIDVDLFGAVLGEMMGSVAPGSGGDTVPDPSADGVDDDAEPEERFEAVVPVATPIVTAMLTWPLPESPQAAFRLGPAPAGHTGQTGIQLPMGPFAVPSDVVADRDDSTQPLPVAAQTSDDSAGAPLDLADAGRIPEAPGVTIGAGRKPGPGMFLRSHQEASEPQATIDDVSPVTPHVLPDAAKAKRHAIASEIANIATNGEPDALPADESKPRSVPRPDAAVKPAPVPFPFQAIGRGYAQGDQDAPGGFTAPKEQSLLAGPKLSAEATLSVPQAFAMPMDARPSTLAAPMAETPVTAGEAIETQAPRIVQSIRLQAVDGGGEAIIRLQPDYLGELLVAVKVDRGSVTAALQTETPAVRQWIERNEAVLRQALAEQGLQLERLTVSGKTVETEPEGERQPPQSRGESRQHQRRRPRHDDEATFEITV